MSIRSNKRDVLTTIGAYTSLARERGLPIGNDTFSSLNENKNPTRFLLDILKVTMGSNGIRTLIGEFFVNIVDLFEPPIKDALLFQIVSLNHNDDLPQEFVNDGINIPIKDIDPFNVFKVNPVSSVGELLYGENLDNFNHAVFDAINADGTDIEYGNIVLNFDSVTEEINVKPKNGNQKINNFFNDYIENATLIERDVFSANVLDLIFGSITFNKNKSIEEIYEEKKIERKIDNLINHVFEDKSAEEILNIENNLVEIYDQTVDLKNGVRNVFMGCEIVKIPETFEVIEDGINLFASETNPNRISNKFDEMILNSSEASGIPLKNKNTLLDNAYDNIIDLIKHEIIKLTILSPEILLMFHLSNTFKNEMIYEKASINNFLSDNINLINCLIKRVLNEFNKFIFNLVLEALKQIIKPIISIIIREKITQYIRLLKSLIR